MMRLLIFALLPYLLFPAFSSAAETTGQQNDNPNVWNFQIARKIIAAFQYNGMGMSIWEDQGVENTTIVSRRQFYVTPITEFLPNSTKCEYNDLTGAYFVSYEIQVWNDRLKLAAIDRLREMQIIVTSEQVQPLPFYQVRVTWNSVQQKLQKASLSTTWNNNLQQQSIQQFIVFTNDKETCDKISSTLQTKPEFFINSIVLEYSLSAASTATKILTIKTEHFQHSQLMATLKTMDVQTPTRYLNSDDADKLTMEIMDNVIASQIVDGEYVPESDQLTMKDLVTSSLQLVNVDTGNFSSKMWESVFWDPVYARPDKITSYLNKILKINQGNHTVTKTSAYNDKDEEGLNLGIGNISFGGKSSSESSSSASFSDLNEWFRQHNYDLEIKGDIFVPKSLNLKQLNMGVLDRQETIFTKTVQIHHVDAPGTMRVTAGAKSVAENEDIKTLRTRLDQLEGWKVNVIEPKLTAIVTQEAQDTQGLKTAVANLQSLTSQMHIPSCSTHISSAMDIAYDGCRTITALCMDRFGNIACPSGKSLTQFRFDRPHGLADQVMQVIYVCC